MDCLKQIRDPICDSYLEEDCEYHGELLYSSNRGAITAASNCQEECEDWGLNSECKYWIFKRKEKVCILMNSGEKTCAVWGWPKKPTYDHCQYF